MLKLYLKNKFPLGSSVRWLLGEAIDRPFTFLLVALKSLYASWILTKRFWPITVRIHSSTALSLNIHSTASVRIDGVLISEPWGGIMEVSSITVGQNAILHIAGDFVIGPGTHLNISTGGSLYIGGRDRESASGITCRSRVMVERSVSIGKDCLIAWGVFITDSDWHSIRGKPRSAPVIIEDHVWIAHDVSILKSSIVPYGCIVAPKSVVVTGGHRPRSLIAGQPAVVKRDNVEWSR